MSIHEQENVEERGGVVANTVQGPMDDLPGLLEWLGGKIEQAESALKSREQMETTFRGGTEESWTIAAEMHPDTAGKPMSKAARTREADIQGRIANKCRRDVQMFKAIQRHLTENAPKSDTGSGFSQIRFETGGRNALNLQVALEAMVSRWAVRREQINLNQLAQMENQNYRDGLFDATTYCLSDLEKSLQSAQAASDA